MWQVGDVTITRIEERVYRFPIAQFIPGATPEVLAPRLGWLGDFGVDDLDLLVMPVNGYVLACGDRRILVDTCVGLEHSGSEPASPFVDRLRASGVEPDAVDTVLCTHFHYDHVGWNTTVVGGERVPTFPRARYVFAREEWDAVREWSPTSDLEGMLRESFDREVATVVDAGAAELRSGAFAVSPEVSVVPTPGHSPGHVSVVVRSGGQEALITGDAIHHPVQLALPEVGTTADDDHRATVATREGLIDRLVDRPVLLVGSHFAGAGAGYLRHDGGDVVLRPAGGGAP